MTLPYRTNRAGLKTSRRSARLLARCCAVALIPMLNVVGEMSAIAGGYVIERAAIHPGGRAVSGGGYSLTGTVGQAEATIADGGGYRLYGGFRTRLCRAASSPEPELIDSDSGAPLVLVTSVKNRFLSFEGVDAGRPQAVRVTFQSLPPPWDVWDGLSFWVREPEAVCEQGGRGLGDPCPVGVPTFNSAGLSCSEEFYTDWSTYGVVHLRHPGIVPDGVYRIEVLDATCRPMNAAGYSIPLNLPGPNWGDVAGAFDSGAALWVAADDSVDVTTDVVATLGKFQNRLDAPIKARIDVEPCVVDHKANISDVTQVLDAFRSKPFPFEPGGAGCPLDPCAGGP